MMDNSGAVIGSLLAFVLLRFFTVPLRTVFAAAMIPGLGAVLVVLVFLREPPQLPASPVPAPLSRAPAAPHLPFTPAARRYLGALAVFSLAGSGDMFLVYRLVDLGMAAALVPIAWMTLQLGKALLNVPGGKAADRFGRRPLLVLAWILYAVTYAVLGLVHGWELGWAVLGVYALHYGLAEGGQRALLAECVPPEMMGRAYGALLALEGAMVLPANVLFGVAYARLGAPAAFGAAGVVALVGAGLLTTVRPSSQQATAATRSRARAPAP